MSSAGMRRRASIIGTLLRGSSRRCGDDQTDKRVTVEVDNMLKSGALSDLSKCTDLAYCLGLINKAMLENIKRIADVRKLLRKADKQIGNAMRAFGALGGMKPQKVHIASE